MRRLSIFIAALAVLASAPTGPAQTPAPAPTTIPEGVTIATTPVGGLTPEVAAEQVRAEYALPLVLGYGTYIFEARPEALAVPAIQRAVTQALTAAPYTTVPLEVTVRRLAVRTYVGEIADRLARKPVDARLLLRRLKPWIAAEKAGREIDRVAAEGAITAALQAGRRAQLVLKAKVLRPKVTRASFGPVVVIRRGSNALYLYQRHALPAALRRRDRPAAVPDAARPLPHRRQVEEPVVVPARLRLGEGQGAGSARARQPARHALDGHLQPRSSGSTERLSPGSIGYSVSHGCIRLTIRDAEWLFERVAVGTTVFIVSA